MFCLHYALFYSRYMYEKEMLAIIMQSKAYSYFGGRMTMALWEWSQFSAKGFKFKTCTLPVFEFKSLSLF